MTRARLELFGGFRLADGQGRNVEISSKKGRGLIAILAVAPRGEVSRDRLAALLWSDRGEEQARNSLRQALLALRKDFAGLDADPLLLAGDRVGLDPRALSNGVAEFLQYSTSADPADLRKAFELYTGPFLDGLAVPDEVFEDWLRDARTDLAQHAMTALSALAELVDGAERIAIAQKLVALDPLREESCLALMRAHLAQGDSVAAIKVYETCRLLLKRELGVEPGDELRKQRDSIKTAPVKPAISTASTKKPVVAVLPLENLSGDPGQQYFSDGITHDIIDRLSKFRILSVIGHHSSFAFRGDHQPMREIREKLAADFVLTGNIRKSDSRVRISVRLTDSASESAVWAESYERQLEDIFSVQDEVANVIASTLTGRVEIEVANRSRAAGPASIASYEYVLEGLWHFKKLTRAGNSAAIDCFEKAIAAQPGNAEAHRCLAGCLIGWWYYDFSRAGLEEGMANALRAVELDPTSAGCHAALGLCQLWMGNSLAAEHSYRKAYALNPGDPNVSAELAAVNVYAGRIAEGHELFAQAFKLNPLPPLWYAEFQSIAAFAEGRYAEAMPAFAAIPDGAWEAMYVVSCLGHLGKREEAVTWLKRHNTSAPGVSLLEGARMEPFLDPEPRQRLIEGLEKVLAF